MHYPALSLETSPRIIVLANGEFPHHPLPLSLIDAWERGEDGWQLFCCDGATNSLDQYTSKAPNAIVGDLDSISPELKERHAERLVHIREQDTNDLTKTMTYIHQTFGKSRVIIIGSSGGREDHLIGNIFLLPNYRELCSELIMLTNNGYFRLITEPSSLEMQIGQQISIFAPTGAPVSFDGVHWPLEQNTLQGLWAGTLNRADKPLVHLSSPEPLLAFIAL